MEAFEMIKTTEMTANDAKRLLQGCFVQAIAKQETEPRFVPQTDDWDYEFAEQRTFAEDRIAELDGQTVSEKYDGEVLTRVHGLLTRNGFSQHDISEARFKDLANGMARILVEQQKLFLARIEDRFATYTPSDPLFTQVPQNHSGMVAVSGGGSTFHGPNLRDAVDTYSRQQGRSRARKA